MEISLWDDGVSFEKPKSNESCFMTELLNEQEYEASHSVGNGQSEANFRYCVELDPRVDAEHCVDPTMDLDYHESELTEDQSSKLGDEDVLSMGQRPNGRVGNLGDMKMGSSRLNSVLRRGRENAKRPKKLKVWMQLGNNKNAKVTELMFGISVEIPLYFGSPEVRLWVEVTDGVAIKVSAGNFRFQLFQATRNRRQKRS